MLGLYVIIGVIAGALLLISTIWSILNIIGYWRMFNKMGEAGWKAIIPFYNEYILFSRIWDTGMFFVYLILSFSFGIIANISKTLSEGGAVLIMALLTCVFGIALIVIKIMKFSRLSQAFGYGGAFTLGLLFLEGIFVMILGFGSANYLGNPTDGNGYY